MTTWITLPNCDKVLVCKIGKDRKPLFTPQFMQLWLDFMFVGDFLFNYQSLNKLFPLPQLSNSRLNGIGQLTSPGSVARLVLFNSEGDTGPIQAIDPNNNFTLLTFNSLSNLSVSWKVRQIGPNYDPKTLTIGFYTSANFKSDLPTNLILHMSQCDGPCLFYGMDNGEVVIVGPSDIYVAVDQDVVVDLDVRVVIPKEYGGIPPNYTKYIEVYDNQCNLFKLPVFVQKPLDADNILVNITPTEQFAPFAFLIQNYLQSKTLNIPIYYEDTQLIKEVGIPEPVSLSPNSYIAG